MGIKSLFCRLTNHTAYTEELFAALSAPLLSSHKLALLDQFTQHGSTTCLMHSLAVAYYSLWLVRLLRLHCHAQSLVTGALLHDYFLYDWHRKDKSHAWHGFTHPRRALCNARADFKLDPIEQNIIARHMFPLTLIPPQCREAAVVCLVDKVCCIQEILRADPYRTLRERYWKKT